MFKPMFSKSIFKSEYKKKAAILSTLIIVIAAVYILSYVLDPQNRRDAAFAWLDSNLQNMADRIEISGDEGRTVLSRVNNVWYFLSDANPDGSSGSAGSSRMLPVKQEKVGDLFALLGRKGVYPVRASTQEAIERLGLDEGKASRIIVRGGVGLPLLDLFIGFGTALGREINLRRAGWNRIYTTEEDFYSFTEVEPASWYDLRLFPPTPEESGGNLGRTAIGIDRVQQVEISLLGKETFIFRRSGQGWVIPGDGTVLDTIKVEAWLRLIIEAQADDFGFSPPDIVEGSCTLRLGDGTSRTLMVGPIESQYRRESQTTADGQKYRSVTVSGALNEGRTPQGSSLVYIISDTTFSNFFELSFAYLNDSP